MAGRNRWTQLPTPNSINQGTPEPPREDNCCCSWFKPKSKSNESSDAPKLQEQGTASIPNRNSNGSKKTDERSDAPKVQQWQGTVDIPKGNSNGSNKNTWCDNMQPNDSSGVSRDQRVIPKNNKYTEIDPVETTKNGAVNEFKGKQVWTHDQGNSDGVPRNMKPSPQNHKISSPGQGHLREDNKQEEIKKKGKSTGPNSTNVTRSMDGVYSSEEKQRSNIIPKEEDSDGSYGGTKPDSTKNKGNHGGTRSDPNKSSTFEQAGPWKEKENDHIKNRQEDILEDHHKAVHKSEYNHGINRDKGNHAGTRSNPTKSSNFENDRTKNRHEGILEDHHKAVHKPEYNHGPDLTMKESSSPDSEQAGVQKRRGKQGINTKDEYTNPTNPSTKGFSHASI